MPLDFIVKIRSFAPTWSPFPSNHAYPCRFPKPICYISWLYDSLFHFDFHTVYTWYLYHKNLKKRIFLKLIVGKMPYTKKTYENWHSFRCHKFVCLTFSWQTSKFIQSVPCFSYAYLIPSYNILVRFTGEKLKLK